jgi:hypothetical protein
MLIGVLTSFYFGPPTPMGNDFEASHVGFQEGFQEPFAAHVKNCFRESCLLPTSKNYH